MYIAEYWKEIDKAILTKIAEDAESVEEQYNDLLIDLDGVIEKAIAQVREVRGADEDLIIKDDNHHYIIHCTGDENYDYVTVTDVKQDKVYTIGQWYDDGYFDTIFTVAEYFI